MSHSNHLFDVLQTIKDTISQQIPASEIALAKHRHALDNIIQRYPCYIAIGQLRELKPVYLCPLSMSYLGIAQSDLRNFVFSEYQHLLHNDNRAIIFSITEHFKSKPGEFITKTFSVKRHDDTWQDIYAIGISLYDEPPHLGNIIIALFCDVTELLEKKRNNADNNAALYMNEDELKKYSTLSKREKEVLQMVSLEKTNQEIADILFISKHTVEEHRKNLMKKLVVNSAAGLAVFATKAGLV